MASNNTSSKGAAEEPDSPPPTTSSRPAPPRGPREFQRPHLEDREGGGGGGGASSKTTKPKPITKPGTKPSTKPSANTKASDTGKDRPPPDKGKGKGKGKDAPPLDICGWCERLGAKWRCTQCKSEVYCNEECQRVGGALATLLWSRVDVCSSKGSTARDNAPGSGEGREGSKTR